MSINFNKKKMEETYKRNVALPVALLLVQEVNKEVSEIEEWFSDLVNNLYRIPILLYGDPILKFDEITEEIRLNLNKQGYINATKKE